MSEIKVDLNRLNTLTNKVYRPYYKEKSRVALFYGGAGSGKSVFCAQKLVYRCIIEQGHKFVVFRKVGATIKNSVFALIKQILSDAGLLKFTKVNLSEHRFTLEPFGSEIICAGLDEPEKLKSIAGVTGIWFEEATEFEEEDIDQAMLRVRGQLKHYVQFIFSLNPINEKHYIKGKFFDTPDANTCILKTTYKDNQYLDKDYINHLETRVKANENLYRVYVLGEWGKENADGNCYKNFKRSAHVKNTIYQNPLPICLSWDFNVLPYTTTLVIQVEGRQVKVHEEICLTYPHNRTRDNCAKFVQKYPHHAGGVSVFGDSTGDQEGSKDLFGENNYTLIFEGLRKYLPTFRVPEKNPPVKRRIEFIDQILANNLYGISIDIHPNCTNLIEDLENVKENEDGTKLKTRIKNKKTKQSYEPYGHTTDALEYFMCQYFKSEFEDFLNGGLLPEKPMYITKQQSKYDY